MCSAVSCQLMLVHATERVPAMPPVARWAAWGGQTRRVVSACATAGVRMQVRRRAGLRRRAPESGSKGDDAPGGLAVDHPPPPARSTRSAPVCARRTGSWHAGGQRRSNELSAAPGRRRTSLARSSGPGASTGGVWGARRPPPAAPRGRTPQLPASRRSRPAGKPTPGDGSELPGERPPARTAARLPPPRRVGSTPGRQPPRGVRHLCTYATYRPTLPSEIW